MQHEQTTSTSSIVAPCVGFAAFQAAHPHRGAAEIQEIYLVPMRCIITESWNLEVTYG